MVRVPEDTGSAAQQEERNHSWGLRGGREHLIPAHPRAPTHPPPVPGAASPARGVETGATAGWSGWPRGCVRRGGSSDSPNVSPRPLQLGVLCPCQASRWGQLSAQLLGSGPVVGIVHFPRDWTNSCGKEWLLRTAGGQLHYPFPLSGRVHLPLGFSIMHGAARG